MTFRVPLLKLQQSFNSVVRIRFPFGFSSRMVFLIWCVCGGFLVHFFEASFLSILLKPTYEKAIDTAQDVLDRGLSVILNPGSESYVVEKKNSLSNITRRLVERTIVTKVILFINLLLILLIMNIQLIRIGMNMIGGF